VLIVGVAFTRWIREDEERSFGEFTAVALQSQRTIVAYRVASSFSRMISELTRPST
jgi:hypothetical protein